MERLCVRRIEDLACAARSELLPVDYRRGASVPRAAALHPAAIAISTSHLFMSTVLDLSLARLRIEKSILSRSR
jgi:hypothetical protein